MRPGSVNIYQQCVLITNASSGYRLKFPSDSKFKFFKLNEYEACDTAPITSDTIADIINDQYITQYERIIDNIHTSSSDSDPYTDASDNSDRNSGPETEINNLFNPSSNITKSTIDYNESTDHGRQADVIQNDVYYELDNSIDLVSETDNIPSATYTPITIVFIAESEGEYIDTVEAVDSSTGEVIGSFSVGIQVYDKDEKLYINASNMGIELPSEIDNAMLEKIPYEMHTDWNLLNDKMRELLVNYDKIWMNKGSYKSIKNALNWFGYRYVDLYNIWKVSTPSGIRYISSPISQDSIESQYTDAFDKTTSYNMRINTSNIQYIDDYYVEDYSRQQKFELTEEEMKDKTVLLKEFMNQYFMPVHSKIKNAYFDRYTNEKITYNKKIYYTVIEN